jgi:hypothetical protein
LTSWFQQKKKTNHQLPNQPQTAKAPERFLFLGPILKRYASRHEKKVDLKGGHAHDQRHQDKKVSGETSKEIHITEAKIITSDPTFAART